MIAADSANPDARVLATEVVPLAPRDHLREEIEEFAGAIRGQAQVEVGLAEALANVAVLQAAARSLRTGQPTTIAEIMAEIEEA